MKLIDADALKKEMEIAPLYAVDMYTACAVIDMAPEIEPEVRQGRWIEGTSQGSYSIYCSYCGSQKETICPSNYCPNCGARMSECTD